MKVKKTTLTLFIILNLLHLSCDSDVNWTTHHSVSLPALHEAVDADDLEEVKRLATVKKCSLFESDTEKNWDISYLASEGKCFDVNFKSNFRSGRKRTALFYVKSVEMAEFLFEQGADVNIKDRYQETPLHTVSTVPVAKFFLEKGVNIETKDEKGKTPLYSAVYWKRYDVAEFLFEQGANPRATTNRNFSPRSEAKHLSKWHTFRLNRLIKKFEAYTPPETKKVEETEEQNLETSE